jgi:hypothetical protein
MNCVSGLRLGVIAFLLSANALAATFETITVVTGTDANAYEQRYAKLLHDRLELKAAVDVLVQDAPRQGGLTVCLGVAERHPLLRAVCEEHGIRLPGPLDPGAEGFVLQSLSENILVAMGSDSRGVLYAVGEILRQSLGRENRIELPTNLAVREAPRFRYRGTLAWQGHTITELTGSRKWTDEETCDNILNYALAGANTFEVWYGQNNYAYQLLQDYGLMTLTDVNGNAGKGPAEWQAKEAIGRLNYLCPSIPEARQALLEQREAMFKNMPFYDIVRYKSADGGGCECEKCAPYGGAFIRLCEDYTRLLHKYHPDTIVFAGNQKLDNVGEHAIFDYLQEEPREWLSGIVYGPGSDAMGWMPGRRQDHRTDLFEYAGFGAQGGYLKEMLRQMPARQGIFLFTDMTHWVYSQYGLLDHELIADRDYQLPPEWDFWMYARRPDPNLAMVYNRRTFHARPRNYYRAFQETMRYAIGECSYSEGHHDHFNQWMAQRLMWHPQQSVEDVVMEYARVHFGPEAAPRMAEVLFQHELNLETPIESNPGIDDIIDLLKKAGAAMPPSVMERDYLWRQYMQKAYLDKYIQLDVRRQRKAVADNEAKLKAALEGDNLAAVLAETSQALADRPDTDAMARLKGLAKQLGEESDRIYGVRSEGFFNLEQDYVGRGWIKRKIEEAATQQGSVQRDTVRSIVYYEDAGEGGFYDDAGNPEKSPHLIYGWPFGDGGFSGFNKLSQRTVAFSTDEAKGVTFAYDDLDPKAHYRVRFTLVRPKYLPRFGIRQPQTKESIYADGIPLVEALELPEYESKFFDYDIPKEATSDGELSIWFEKEAGIGEGVPSDVTLWRNTGGWGTLVSEVWLMKEKADSN